MKNKLLAVSLVSAVSIVSATPAHAICPVCTIAVGAGLGISRWLGIDDMISGLWIGALAVSVSLWTLDWLKKKAIKFPLKNILVFGLTYGTIILSLYWSKAIGRLYNDFCGIDKILFGLGLGSIIFTLAVLLNDYLKKRNGGKVFFPYQKVVIPVSLLTLASIVVYIISKC